MKLVELFRIDVHCTERYTMENPDGVNMKMVLFDGTVSGEYFNGVILPGGVDTQTWEEGKAKQISARYMLEGTDKDGEKCIIYIENNGLTHGEAPNRYFICQPTIRTNSKALNFLNTDLCASEAIPRDGGPIIIIYRMLNGD